MGFAVEEWIIVVIDLSECSNDGDIEGMGLRAVGRIEGQEDGRTAGKDRLMFSFGVGRHDGRKD